MNVSQLLMNRSQLLDKNNICYEVFEDFIAEEKVFRRTYEMEMI